jgi:transposase InsO family protein
VNVYPFIEAEKAGNGNVKKACELLEVSRSAYYQQRTDQPTARERSDADLSEQIHQLHEKSKGRYGAPRIHAALRRTGRRHGRKRVARLMRTAGLRGRAPKRWKKTTVPDPGAAVPIDLIRRDFGVDATKINSRGCGLPRDRRRSRSRRHCAATGVVRGRQSSLAGATDDYRVCPALWAPRSASRGGRRKDRSMSSVAEPERPPSPC